MSKTLVFCDFDGTVSVQDIGHEVIKHFMNGNWQEIDEEYASGKIGSKFAYERIASLLKVTAREMAEYALSLETMDPYFHEFYEFCKERQIDLKILSDGLDFYIDLILKRHGLDEIEFFSNLIRFHDDSSVFIDFPRFNKQCAKCGTCKKAVLEQCRTHYNNIIYVGDGYSDVCPSQFADLVFGKKFLYEKCRHQKRACIHYRNFGDIKETLQNGRHLV
jgi:2,3-diketo-5-methylthio-1-phosphopentane phosphatase